MDERDHQPDPSNDATSDSIDADKGVTIYPKSLFDYHPRVDIPLDLLIDLQVGVVVGRSDSFHKKYSTVGLGMIGAISEMSDDPLTSLVGMPVTLDLVSPHVMFVAGKRGSGKSYTLGILIEELSRAMSRAEIEVAAVVIDTVDVFRQTVEPNNDQTELIEKWGMKAQGFPAAVYIPKRTYSALPADVKTRSNLYPLAISPRELSSSDWGYILEKGGDLSTTMENLIGDIVDSLHRGFTLSDGGKVSANKDYSIKDMIRCIESNPSITEFYKPATRTAMIQRLRRAHRLGVFHPGGTSAQDLAIAGQITIIDVAPLGSDAEAVLAILTNMLCRQVLTYRMAWTDEGTSAREELPPTWLIIDEAHTLVPRSGHTPAKNAIIGYAKLGRRFGCSLVLCTQQPSAVSDDAISQADIILSHSLSHDGDIRALQQRAPAVMPDLFRDKVFISSLPRGVALLFDQSTENKRGFIFQVRPRLSQHGGTDRLSGLLEAATLMAPETPDYEEDVEIPHLEDEFDEPEDEILDELPSVPRPPLKLSKDDWDALDEWIREYVQKQFEQKSQEYSITEEPAPRIEQDEPVEPIIKPEVILEVADGEFPNRNRVRIARFSDVRSELLSKAVTRLVLYAKPSHEFLFSAEKLHRQTIPILLDSHDALMVLDKVFVVLQSAGFTVHSLVDYDEITYVLLRKDELRASLAVGTSSESVSIPIVIVGTNSRSVTSVATEVQGLF
ncbi:MAG: DUF87 domain-containing protein [Candidatus Thorarchaeota archaeon]